MNETLDHPNDLSKSYTRSEWLAYGLFWSWNVIFLAFMALGFAPTMLPETFTAVRTGLIPASFLLYGLVLTLVPLAAVVLGLTLLRRQPKRLFALGYVVEGPLMLLLIMRLFLIRQATPAINLMFLVALLGMSGYLWYLLQPHGQRLGWLRLVGLTLMAVVSLYAAAWMTFYAIPIAAEVLRMVGDLFGNLLDVLRDIGSSLWEMLTTRPYMILFSILGVILLFYTASLFVVAPIAVPYLSLRAWWKSLQNQKGRSGWLASIALTAFVLAVCAGLFVWANRQPQQLAFKLLEKPPKSTEEARLLIGRSDAIRAGLVNAYLAPFRYLSAVGEVNHISEIYMSTFKMQAGQAFAIQSLYEGLARPMLYKPIHARSIQDGADRRALVEEPLQAARMYQRFFDTPITEGERATIVSAVRSTWQADQAEAAWQAVDDREVRLVNQEIQISPQGDWAELELHEVYQNQTADEQEVIYYFNLPESAVITGLWLGSSPDKSKAFKYQVAPRGAAQAVYREQTRVMKDPALVEQIGPRQYRLRAYPVPPQQIQYDEEKNRSLVEQAPEMHLWLTWSELASQDGSWPLPRLAFLRNVFWDEKTTRLVDGVPLSVSSNTWLPESLALPPTAAPAAHRVDLPAGQTILALPAGQSDLPALPNDLRLAIVLDRSRSMQDYSDEMSSALERLSGFEAPVDVYLTSSAYRGEEPSIVPLAELNAGEILYFGGQNAAQLLLQYDKLRGDRQYDAVIVLTDGSGYELGETDIQVPVPDIPVWLVHLSGDLPLGYDDQTLKAVQASGGGVAGDIEDALERLAVRLTSENVQDQSAQPDPGESPVIRDLVDGYYWLVLPTAQADEAAGGYENIQMHSTSDPFGALAVRRYILAEMQRNRGSIDQLETLDYLHALASEYGIVSPYSSMIVLVDLQQQRLLDQLSELEDRYQREVEALSETTPASPLPLTGVPEPHEWLLLALSGGMLIYLAYKKYHPAWAFRLNR